MKAASAPRRFACLAVACLLPLACASAVPEGAGGTWAVRPPVWSAVGPEAGDGVLLLLGSIHLGRTEFHDFGPGVAAAYEASDEVVVEVDLSRLSRAEIAAVSARYVMLPDGQKLSDVLDAETYARLEAYFEQRGDQVAAYERMRPWAVGMSIALLEYSAAGLHGDYGVDQHFIDAAAAEERPIRALESMQSQLAAIDGISPKGQQLMLEDTLARVGDDPAELVRAWENGDEARLEELLLGPLEENPEFAEFYDALFFERNERMAAQLASLSADGKRRFVVLGAAHMIGEYGIPALLAARGFSVERLGAEPGGAPFGGGRSNGR